MSHSSVAVFVCCCASLVAERGLGTQAQLQLIGSRVWALLTVAHRLKVPWHGTSWTRDQSRVPCILYHWTTQEVPRNQLLDVSSSWSFLPKSSPISVNGTHVHQFARPETWESSCSSYPPLHLTSHQILPVYLQHVSPVYTFLSLSALLHLPSMPPSCPS